MYEPIVDVRSESTTALVCLLSLSLCAEVSDTFLKVSPEYASGYIIITAVATFVVTLLIMLPAVIIIACVCLKHALKKHEENFSDKKTKF